MKNVLITEDKECVLKLSHPEWSDKVCVFGARAKRLTNDDEAAILSWTDDEVMLHWDRWDTEWFVKEDDGVFHHRYGLPASDNDRACLAPEERKKVAVLYIATGRYIVFWQEFHKACRQYFLNGHDVHYFLFTDHDEIEVDEDTTLIRKEFYPWPMETLRRFETFLSIEHILSGFDYMYFLNANLLPVAPIREEVFPSPEQGLMVTIHPGYYRQPRHTWTYERNSVSEACIPSGQGEIYAMGAFNGGSAAAFLRMCRELDQAVKRDLSNGVIAVWHDESHLNKYILGRSLLVLTPEYLLPEYVVYNQDILNPLKKMAKMIMLDKNRSKYGALDWLRQL